MLDSQGSRLWNKMRHLKVFKVNLALATQHLLPHLHDSESTTLKGLPPGMLIVGTYLPPFLAPIGLSSSLWATRVCLLPPPMRALRDCGRWDSGSTYCLLFQLLSLRTRFSILLPLGCLGLTKPATYYPWVNTRWIWLWWLRGTSVTHPCLLAWSRTNALSGRLASLELNY